MSATSDLRFVLPPAIFLAAIVLASLAGVWVPLPWIPPPLSDFLFAMGLAVWFGAAWIILAALGALRRAGTTVLAGREPQHLVTRGPFSFTRNPIYVGLLMLLFGGALVFGQPWLFLAALLAGLLLQKLVVLPEERMLESRFSRAWRDYRKRVRRWI